MHQHSHPQGTSKRTSPLINKSLGVKSFLSWGWQQQSQADPH